MLSLRHDFNLRLPRALPQQEAYFQMAAIYYLLQVLDLGILVLAISSNVDDIKGVAKVRLGLTRLLTTAQSLIMQKTP